MSLNTIDVRDLLGHPGVSREEAVSGTIDGLAGELARVPEDTPVIAHLTLRSIVEGILVEGDLAGRWVLRCARCLTEFEAPFHVRVQELFVTEPEADPDGYELDPEVGIDPEQMMRDAIGVEMPFSPLCREDCRGLCATCGGNRNLGGCPGHAVVDPRLAVLSEISFPETDV